MSERDTGWMDWLNLEVGFLFNVLVLIFVAILVARDLPRAEPVAAPQVHVAPEPTTAGATLEKTEVPPEVETARKQPIAVLAGELVAPWSSIRVQLAEVEAEQARVDEVNDVLQTLILTRRDPSRTAPWSETRARLDELESTLTDDPTWATDSRIQYALEQHRAAIARYPAAE